MKGKNCSKPLYIEDIEEHYTTDNMIALPRAFIDGVAELRPSYSIKFKRSVTVISCSNSQTLDQQTHCAYAHQYL